MTRFLFLVFVICTLSQTVQGAERHVYDKSETALAACNSHERNPHPGSCGVSGATFYQFYTPVRPRARHYFWALKCPPETTFVGTEGFWWSNSNGPFPLPPRPYCSTEIADLTVEISTNGQEPITRYPGESIDTIISFENASQSTDYEDVVIGKIYLSSDTALDGGDLELVATQGYPSLDAQEKVTHNLSITIPDSKPSGDYYIIGAVNPANYFLFKDGGTPEPEEADFDNNASEPLKVTIESQKVEIEICVGNPISTNSGRKLETEVDYQGTGPFPLEYARYYSSQPGNIKGWNFSYSRHLFVLENDSTTDVILVFDGGQRYEFLDIDNQGYSDPDVPGSIKRASYGFDYLDEIGTTHQFNHNGQLIGLLSLTGFSQTLQYAGGQLIQVSDQFGKSLQLTYTADNQIGTLTTPDNRVYHYEYSLDGLHTTVILPDATPTNLLDNPRREYLYESNNLAHGLTGIIDENGNRYSTFDYDVEGRAILSTHDSGADRNTITYAENETTVTNALGKDTTYVFEEILDSKRLVRVDGHPTVSCPSTSTTKTYDARGSVTEEMDANGNITRFIYTHTGLPTDEYLYHVGLVTSRTEAVGTSDARTTTIAWHPDFRLPAVITEPGHQIELTYDNNARMIERTETALDTGVERTWTNQYDSTGLLVSINGPRLDVSDATTLAYNSEGELSSIANALGHTTAILAHDDNGLPTTVQDPNGLITHLGYDDRLRLISQRVVSDAGESSTWISYDEKGNVITITLPDGQTLHYQYDLADRLIQISNDLGEVIEYTIDADGNRTAEITRNANSSIVRVQNRAFDELSRLINTIGAANQTTHFGYDNNGNLQIIEDALGRETHLSFDGLDRLINVTDALQGDSSFTYDDRDNLTSVTDAEGVVTTFEYDGMNNLLTENSTARGKTTYQHDTAGNRIHAVDANGVQMTYTYDALNRLADIRYSGSQEENVTYTYDQGDAGIGQLTGTTDESGSTTFTYDDRGNLLTDHRLIEGMNYTTRYAYNLANQLTQMIYPSGRIVHYGLDSISRMTAITTQANAASPIMPIASDLKYLPFGPPTNWQHGNGLTTAIDYDQDYRVTNISVEDEQDLNEIMSVTYGYNDVSNITQILDNLGINSQTFEYDELNRLTSASGNFGDTNYSYDGVGNRLSRTITKDSEEKSEAYQYESGSHRLQSVNTTDSDGSDTRSITHDANGNTTGDASGDRTLDMVINARNRLSQINKDGKQVGEYTYNALGQRVSKTSSYRGRIHAHVDEGSKDDTASDKDNSNGKGKGQDKNQNSSNASTDNLHATTDNKKVTEHLHFHYDQLGNLIGESDEDGNPIREYIYLGNFRIAMAATSIEQGSAQANKKQPLALYYIHNDHLGAAGKVTDADQRIVWSMEQSPFGEVTLSTEALQMPMRFPGQYADLESGFSYNYFRDYDPTLGRYIQSDPVGLMGGSNVYLYVVANPLKLIDRDGKNPVIVGAVVGFASGVFGTLIANPDADSREVLINGLTGALIGSLTGAGVVNAVGVAGAISGFVSNLVAQVQEISSDPCKTLSQELNFGSLAGSAAGGFLAARATRSITTNSTLTNNAVSLLSAPRNFVITSATTLAGGQIGN